MNITDDMVTEVAGRHLVGAGPGGMESVRLQHWLLQYGDSSAKLRKIIASITEWLANSHPPRAAYWALVAGFLIVMDK